MISSGLWGFVGGMYVCDFHHKSSSYCMFVIVIEEWSGVE